MMCGCPISEKKLNSIVPGDVQPWLPEDFEVIATMIPCIDGGIPIGGVQLFWDASSNVAGWFVATVEDLVPGTFQMTVVAQQMSTGNTGVDMSTFVVQSASPRVNENAT